MLKPLVSRFRPGPSVRLKDIAEKQVPANLKPIVGANIGPTSHGRYEDNDRMPTSTDDVPTSSCRYRDAGGTPTSADVELFHMPRCREVEPMSDRRHTSHFTIDTHDL